MRHLSLVTLPDHLAIEQIDKSLHVGIAALRVCACARTNRRGGGGLLSFFTFFATFFHFVLSFLLRRRKGTEKKRHPIALQRNANALPTFCQNDDFLGCYYSFSSKKFSYSKLKPYLFTTRTRSRYANRDIRFYAESTVPVAYYIFTASGMVYRICLAAS